MRIPRPRGRGAIWVGISLLAVLTGAVTAVARLWLPTATAAGVAVVAATLAGLWTARGTNALKVRDEHERDLPRLIRLGKRNRLPRVRDCDDPVVLGVHPAAPIGHGGARTRTPPYIVRDATPELCEAIRQDRFVLVVGESMAGKSRLVYEAIRALLPDHWLIAPVGREAIQLSADTAIATPQCVLWLDDLERFLGPDGLTGAAVDGVLAASGGDRFILATMRAEEHAKYSGRSGPGPDEIGREALRRGWEILRLAAHVHLPRSWSAKELHRAAEHRADRRIAEALDHAHQFGVAEYLAAGPQLLADWRDAWAPGTHARAAALVLAAVDARRAGIHRPLDLPTLEQLHEPYLHERGGTLLRPEPLSAALTWATTPLHATSSLLLPASGDSYLAFDYLIDTIEKAPIPIEALDRLIDAATPHESLELGYFAWHLLRHQQAEKAVRRAETTGNPAATSARCDLIRDRYGDAASLQFAKGIADDLAEQFGRGHPVVLEARHRYGWELGMAGDPAAALDCMKQLMTPTMQLHGEHDKKTLDLKQGLANWTGHAGDPATAASMYAELITTYARTLGVDDRDVFDCRDSHAHWTAEAGDHTLALRLQQQLVNDIERAQVPRDDVIGARYRLAYMTTQAGNYDQAQQLWRQVITDAHNAHGRFHTTTLEARRQLAECIGETGDAVAALRLLHEVVPDIEYLGGPRSRSMMRCRRSLAHSTGHAGDSHSAIREFQALITLSTEKLGDNDTATLVFRRRLAYWTGESGDAASAVSMLKLLINDILEQDISNYQILADCRADLQRWQ